MTRPTGPIAVEHLTRRDCERYFRRQGLPLLVEDHSLRRDVFGRSAPFLVFVLLTQVATSFSTEWTPWQNVLAILGALVGICAGYAVLNVLRGRRWSMLPQSVGPVELAFFVLAPALAAWALGGGVWSALATAIGNVVLLALVRWAVGLGLVATLGWGIARLADDLAPSLRRLVRLLPLVLIFSVGLFYNTEVWQVFDAISGQADIALALLFLLGIVVLTSLGARREAEAVLADAATDASPAATTFSPLQRRNLVAMVAASQLLQVLVVSIAVGAFFVALGMLSVTPTVREAWEIVGGSWSRQPTFLGTPLVVDQTLLRVGLALATFNGLYYAINVQVDAVYRAELVDDLSDQLHEVVRVREHYLALALAPAPVPVPGKRTPRP